VKSEEPKRLAITKLPQAGMCIRHIPFDSWCHYYMNRMRTSWKEQKLLRFVPRNLKPSMLLPPKPTLNIVWVFTGIMQQGLCWCFKEGETIFSSFVQFLSAKQVLLVVHENWTIKYCSFFFVHNKKAHKRYSTFTISPSSLIVSS
jgi:hypothetical protein